MTDTAIKCSHGFGDTCWHCNSGILERETIIAKLAAKAAAQEDHLDFIGDNTTQAAYERGYRDTLSRLWRSTANVADVIRTLARL